MSTRTYYWYLEPKNLHTNDVVAQALAEQGAAEEKLVDVKDDKGKRHNLWPCQRSVIQFLEESRSQDLAIKFNVFAREGHGKIRRYPFTGAKAKRFYSNKKTAY